MNVTEEVGALLHINAIMGIASSTQSLKASSYRAGCWWLWTRACTSKFQLWML